MNEAQLPVDLFKRCSMCQHPWISRQGFLEDPSVALVGYQSFLPEPELGLFLFNHLTCETTLALEAKAFIDLYQGPIYSEKFAETEQCPELCLTSTKLCPCPNECECAYVREVLQIVREWPKVVGG